MYYRDMENNKMYLTTTEAKAKNLPSAQEQIDRYNAALPTPHLNSVQLANRNKRGNWVDSPCWYVSVQDAGRTQVVLGPFPTEASCREWAYRDAEDGGTAKASRLREIASKRDPKSWFYAWGMVKTEHGYSSGCLNPDFPDSELDAIRAVPGRLDV